MTQYIDKATVIGQANIEITNCRLAAQQGILTKFGKGKLEGLEGIVDFINNFETKEVVELDKACKWWEDELSYPSMTPEEIKWYKSKVRKFRKAMEDE